MQCIYLIGGLEERGRRRVLSFSLDLAMLVVQQQLFQLLLEELVVNPVRIPFRVG